VTTTYSVFVAPSGDDSNMGTIDRPVATISQALVIARKAQKKHIIVCNATYEESLTVSGNLAGFGIHGGFACPAGSNGWQLSPGRPKVIAAPGKPAIEFDGVTGPFVVEDVDLETPDAPDAGDSSLAVIANNSTSIAIIESSILAGKGAAGSDGNLSAYLYPSASDLQGTNPNGQTGAAAKVCTCPGGTTTTGGAGSDGSSGQPGGAGLPSYVGGDGEGGLSGACPGTRGGDGSVGPNGKAGTGASSLGAVAQTTWQAAGGLEGMPGKPGQGGGGGAGGTRDGGGSGGCGGCGGRGGPAGGGGGASAAMLSINSSIELQHVDLTSSDAGRGGAGSAGQQGQQISGVYGTNADGCSRGGNGGLGGDGGPGGGGAGGVSAGILYVGAQPTMDHVLIKVGAAGAGGKGGAPESNDGIAGLAVHVLDAS
jgi:hypothetical protein